jgi:hypothetical protein
MQTGVQLAQMPMIGPIADEVMKGQAIKMPKVMTLISHYQIKQQL